MTERARNRYGGRCFASLNVRRALSEEGERVMTAAQDIASAVESMAATLQSVKAAILEATGWKFGA